MRKLLCYIGLHDWRLDGCLFTLSHLTCKVCGTKAGKRVRYPENIKTIEED